MTKLERCIFGICAANTVLLLVIKVGVAIPFWLNASLAFTGGIAWALAVRPLTR